MSIRMLSNWLNSKSTVPILHVRNWKFPRRAPTLQHNTDYELACRRYLSTHQHTLVTTLNNVRHGHHLCRKLTSHRLIPASHADRRSLQPRTFSSSPHVPFIGNIKTCKSNQIPKSLHMPTLRCQTLEGASTNSMCLHQHRLLHRSSNHHIISIFGSRETSAWASAVSEAEKLVGYPTSFMSLRCLLSDELSNVALQARKLVGTKHPLLKTARNFVYDGKHSTQTRGLIILLVSKAAGTSKATGSHGGASSQGGPLEGRRSAHAYQDDNTQGMVSGIYPSQRALAEISEMIHTAFLVHKGVVNLKDLLPADGPLNIMDFGNKMAVLSGDFLLANACTGLAQLRNTKVVDFVSQAIGNLTEAAFMAGFAEESSGGQRQRRRLPYGVGISDWAKYVYLSSGSLIAQSCKGALALGGHEAEMQERGFEFGKNMALAQQLHCEIQPFTLSRRDTAEDRGFSLMSAPILLHMEHKKQQQTGSDADDWKHRRVDVKQLYREIRDGPSIEKAQELCSEYAQKSLDAISPFPNSKAKQALINMVRAVSR